MTESDNMMSNNNNFEGRTIDKLITNNDVISPDRYVFWMDDVKILYKDKNYAKFFPMTDMTRVEQLNAMTRFFIYLILILILVDNTSEFIYIPIIGIILCIVMYNVFEIDDKGKRGELLRIRKKKEEMQVEGPDINYRTYQIDDDGDIATVDIDVEEEQKY